jgi:hypothetical protein
MFRVGEIWALDETDRSVIANACIYGRNSERTNIGLVLCIHIETLIRVPGTCLG